jgi:hypothetical protein
MVVNDSQIEAMSARYRRLFFKANRTGPWTCYGCGEDIDDFRKVTVHHADENKRNISPSNLVAGHRSCHVRDHALRQSPEKRQKIAAGVAMSWVGARVIDHR